MSSDLTFITNEPGKTLSDRFSVLLEDDTRFFDCLVGYFFISGFYKLYPSLEHVEKIRILIGLKTDRTAYELLQMAKEQHELAFRSHAETKRQISNEVLTELEKSQDSSEIETGVKKFIEWVRSGKLEIKAHPSENLHAKVYIMTFAEGDRDKGRVITGCFLLSPNIDLLLKIVHGSQKLSDVAGINASSTAAEADEYGQCISNRKQKDSLKLVNTGTIERYTSLWGIKDLTHAGQKYATPYLSLNQASVNVRRRELYCAPK